jgi:hypothetical protein
LTFVSFIFHDVFPLIIHNKCSDFELISPTYFGRDVIWYMPPDQKVDTNAMTSASFGRDINKDEFASALIYKLQRKKGPESDNQSGVDDMFIEDTPTSLQLLVIWGYNNEYSFSLRALLIKHSNTITWDEDTLEKLHSMYLALLRNDRIVKDTWLLDDETISKGTRKDDCMEPLWVSSNM